MLKPASIQRPDLFCPGADTCVVRTHSHIRGGPDVGPGEVTQKRSLDEGEAWKLSIVVFRGHKITESSKGDRTNGEQGRKSRTGLWRSGSQGDKVFQGKKIFYVKYFIYRVRETVFKSQILGNSTCRQQNVFSLEMWPTISLSLFSPYFSFPRNVVMSSKF